VVVGCVYVLRYCDIGVYGLILLIPIAGGGYVLVRDIRDNTQDAQMQIKAHMFVIWNDGIDPTSTPIYAKYERYVLIMGLALGTAVILGIVILILAFAGAPHWVELLVIYGVTMAVLAAIAYLYRPRGEAVDRYMEVCDDSIDLRKAVQLRDLDDFDVDDATGREGTRQWDGKLALPPQPVLIRPGTIPETRLTEGDVDRSYLQSLTSDGVYA
jgi:hypothetical protein